jgi:hypothetical protein
MGVNVVDHPLTGWTPTDVDWHDGRPIVRWCFTEGVEFTDPFFDQTIERCQDDPFRLLFWRQTTGDVMAELARTSPGLELSGIIFHLSRCGSTLLTQMLGQLSQVSVMSEPPVFDHVLRARTQCPELSEPDLTHWLRTVASVLGQPRHSGQTRLVIKLDAWAIRQWPLIRQAFPDTPFLFLYRDPLEVIVSHLGHRGYHMIPGTLPEEFIGIPKTDAQAMTPEQYCATVLRRLCEAALDAADHGHVRLFNYSSLPEIVTDVIAPFFGLDVGHADRAALAAITERDAKNRFVPFVADGADKQKQASPEVHSAVNTQVRPVYEALEAARGSGK